MKRFYLKTSFLLMLFSNVIFSVEPVGEEVSNLDKKVSDQRVPGINYVLYTNDMVGLDEQNLTNVYNFLSADDIYKASWSNKRLREDYNERLTRRKIGEKGDQWIRGFTPLKLNNEGRIINEAVFLTKSPTQNTIGFELTNQSNTFGLGEVKSRKYLYRNIFTHLYQNIVKSETLTLEQKYKYLDGLSESFLNILKTFTVNDIPRVRLAKVISATHLMRKQNNESAYIEILSNEFTSYQDKIRRREEKRRKKLEREEEKYRMSIMSSYDKKIYLLQKQFQQTNPILEIFNTSSALPNENEVRPNNQVAAVPNLENLENILNEIDDDLFINNEAANPYVGELSEIVNLLNLKFDNVLEKNLEGLSSIESQLKKLQSIFEKNIASFYVKNQQNEKVISIYGSIGKFRKFINDCKILSDQANLILTIISEDFDSIMSGSLNLLSDLSDNTIEGRLSADADNTPASLKSVEDEPSLNVIDEMSIKVQKLLIELLKV